jgi:hypothetical protein
MLLSLLYFLVRRLVGAGGRRPDRMSSSVALFVGVTERGRSGC